MTLGQPETAAATLLKWRQQRDALRLLPRRPKLSVVIAAPEGSEPGGVNASLQSLLAQSYTDWEAIVSGPGALGLPSDPRIRHVDVGPGQGLGALKKRAIEAATGEWAGFLDAGDRLNPCALYLVLLELQKSPDGVYTNEVMEAEGRPMRCLSKPRYSWFTLLHRNYIGRFWCARRELFADFPDSLGAHAEHAFLLQLHTKRAALGHVPYFLCHRRERAPGESLEEMVPWVTSHLEGQGISARVRAAASGALEIVPELKGTPLVSVVICFKDKADWTITSAEAVARAAGGVQLELLLVDNGSSSTEVDRVRQAVRDRRLPAEVIDYPHPFNYAAMHSEAIGRRARGEYVLFLNNDVFWKEGSVADLVAWAQFDWVGTVGMRLHYGHGPLQHAGIRAFFGGTAWLARIGHYQLETDLAYSAREVYASTFAACLVKRSTFEAVGGLRPLDLPNGFGDVAFNFERLRRGKHNLYLGGVSGVHLESASRGPVFEYWEEVILEREYADLLQRMVREDLGYDRTPRPDPSLTDFARRWAAKKVKRRFPWVSAIKVELARASYAWRKRRLGPVRSGA